VYLNSILHTYLAVPSRHSTIGSDRRMSFANDMISILLSLSKEWPMLPCALIVIVVSSAFRQLLNQCTDCLLTAIFGATDVGLPNPSH
jgi:hypothetical protein